jgi:hypothetical protein
MVSHHVVRITRHVVHAGALLLGVTSVSHGMKRYAVVLAALLCATTVTFAIINRLAASGPTYTVAQVQAGLLYHPRAWVGRTVLVHGMLYMGFCPAGARCPSMPPVLADPGAGTANAILVYWRFTNPMVGFLETLPLVGPLVDRHLGGVDLYRLQLQPGIQSRSGYPTCNRALLVDGLH